MSSCLRNGLKLGKKRFKIHHMALKDKLKWDGNLENRREAVRLEQDGFVSENSTKFLFYCFCGTTFYYAIEVYLAGLATESIQSAKLAVGAVLEFFYGSWRNKVLTPDGTTGQNEWNPFCLWYEDVMRGLPWACALGDWKAVARIADYPPSDKLPELAKARGETAWGWALISFLRGESREVIEKFGPKIELDKAKRPKLLFAVLMALAENDRDKYEKTLLAYLAFYRKSEFKLNLDKILAFDGTILYYLGRKQGFNVVLPANVTDHIITLAGRDTSNEVHLSE